MTPDALGTDTDARYDGGPPDVAVRSRRPSPRVAVPGTLAAGVTGDDGTPVPARPTADVPPGGPARAETEPESGLLRTHQGRPATGTNTSRPNEVVAPERPVHRRGPPLAVRTAASDRGVVIARHVPRNGR